MNILGDWSTGKQNVAPSSDQQSSDATNPAHVSLFYGTSEHRILCEPMETQHVPASTAPGSSVTLFPALLKIRNEDLERFTGTWCAEDQVRRKRQRERKNMSSFGSRSTRPFDDDGFTGYDPRLESKRFDSFSNFDADSVNDSSPIFSNQPYLAGDDAFSSHPVPRTQSLPSMYSKGGPSLPSPAEMEPDEGFPLKEWRGRNVLELEEKEKKEKEKLQRIIEEAEAYKVEFYRKRQLSIEKKKASNRETEKVFVENQEKFQAEAEKNYWKAIAELIPREVAAIEKRGKKRDKDKEKKASVVVVQGSKPGKPTDLSRMRQILVKLNYNPPQHMKLKPEPTAQPKQDAKAIVINEAAVAAA